VNFDRSQNRISNNFLINIIELYSNFSKFKKISFLNEFGNQILI